jgi:hypothetical protein
MAANPGRIVIDVVPMQRLAPLLFCGGPPVGLRVQVGVCSADAKNCAPPTADT